jgi:hypothetical protein
MEMEDIVQKRSALKTPNQRIRPIHEHNDPEGFVDLLFGDVDLEELFAADEVDEVTQLGNASANGWGHH